MSPSADLNALINLVNQITNGKEYLVATVMQRLEDASTKLPHDQAVNVAKRILSNKLKKSGSLATITQKEFQAIYDEVCTLGNRVAFRDLMGDFLYTEAAAPVAHYNPDAMSARRDTDNVMSLSDSNLVDQLTPLFAEPNLVTKGSFIDNGRKGLELEFSSLGFTNVNAEVLNRNESVVVYSVEADSPFGRFTTYIPAEVKLGTVLMPSVFVYGENFADLSKDNLLSYANDVLRNGLKLVAAHKILSALTKNAEESHVISKAASDGPIAFAAPSLYKNAIDKESDVLEVETPRVPLPKDLKSFTEGEIQDMLIESGLSYDKNVVLMAKSLIAEYLRYSGLRIERLAVESEFDGGMLISASIVGSGGKKTISVPIEVVAGQVLFPSVFTSGSTVGPFEQDSLRSFASSKDSGIFNTAFSNKMGWSYNDLYTHAMQNAVYGNFVETEEALAVIAEVYGSDFHRAAFTDLTNLLNASVSQEQVPENRDQLAAEASIRAKLSEDRIAINNSLMYLYPKD